MFNNHGLKKKNQEKEMSLFDSVVSLLHIHKN
jgi:hypothetical protein